MCNRSNSYPFVDDGDSVFALYLLASLYKMFCFAANLVVNLGRTFLDVRVRAVIQGDSESDSPDV